jgi:DNA primase
VGLELKLIRMLLCHPSLSLMLDTDAEAAFNQFGAEAAERLVQLSQLAQGLGEQGTFAVLAQQLKELGAEYDAIISELAAAPEPEIDGERAWLKATVRQLKGDALKRELDQLFSAGLSSEEIGVRYREITAKQDQLAREAAAEVGLR